MKMTILLLSAICTLVSMGCSSLSSRTGTARGTGKIYPGTREDVGGVALLLSNSPKEMEGSYGTYAFFLLYSIIDFPFSAVVDTICLPYDLATLGRNSETISYGISNHRVLITDGKGLAHGKNLYKFTIKKNAFDDLQISGFTHYKHGKLHGKTEVRGIGSKPITGEYKNGTPWSGGILINATDTRCQTVGPLIFYKNGYEVGSSNIVVVLSEK